MGAFFFRVIPGRPKCCWYAHALWSGISGKDRVSPKNGTIGKRIRVTPFLDLHHVGPVLVSVRELLRTASLCRLWDKAAAERQYSWEVPSFLGSSVAQEDQMTRGSVPLSVWLNWRSGTSWGMPSSRFRHHFAVPELGPRLFCRLLYFIRLFPRTFRCARPAWPRSRNFGKRGTPSLWSSTEEERD